MIITCSNCDKSFDIESSVIPDKGRLLQCNGCDHKWFFKKQVINKPVVPTAINISMGETNFQEIENSKSIKLLEEDIVNSSVIDKNLIKSINNEVSKKELQPETIDNKKNYNILSIVVIFIISFIALVIVMDTLQNPISKIFPNIDFLLYNLYESFNDILLFFSDLI